MWSAAPRTGAEALGGEGSEDQNLKMRRGAFQKCREAELPQATKSRAPGTRGPAPSVPLLCDRVCGRVLAAFPPLRLRLPCPGWDEGQACAPATATRGLLAPTSHLAQQVAHDWGRMIQKENLGPRFFPRGHDKVFAIQTRGTGVRRKYLSPT